ncbi:metal-dependent hydrolase [Erythrobacter sp. BLCC-B19]|uniref:metal-dependent hydrolase n=1 Tax=Erythrobacter sp. BLCC-B19 TaxID=3025315 RepID=UPI002361BD77|nr:metal-dependent hydrolase [Erythrobacter sp. BLCC-B19]WDA42549.1 metal-dependent hydrolase [Erythrobacter sp. BLCC-B19]
MPTIMTHAIVPLAIAAAAGRQRISPRLAFAGVVLAMFPDADVIGFRFGIEYADTWGHRGATHALAFAVIVSAAVALVWREARSWAAFAFLALAMASHGLLDALTSGGLGPALLWPASDARIFAPVTPILVSPIGAGFFSARGAATMLSELQLVWLPCCLMAAAGWLIRRRDKAALGG